MNAIGFAPFKQLGVEFDPVEHRYTYFGQPVVNVTSVLRAHKISADWSSVPPNVLENKRDIGRAAHVAAHYFDEGDLQPATVAPSVTPYLDAWRRFVEEQEFEPLVLETTLIHPNLRVGGTVDRWGIVHRLHPDALPSVVDIKTGDPEDAGAGPQTAAYEQLIRAVLPELYLWLIAERDGVSADRPPWTLSEIEQQPWTRYSVRLKPSGRYELHTYNRYEDLKRFMWALNLEASAHPSWKGR